MGDMQAYAGQDGYTRAMAAAGIGTFVEFFDYASYAYLATTIAVVFFPPGDRASALIGTFAIFAVSFAMRPVGAMFWGHFGDRIGRRRTLLWTVLGIGMATFAIGILPGYGDIGILAPVMLVILRLVQSFCTAGEYSGAAVLVGEFAPAHKRGRYVSVVPISCALGFLLASELARILHVSLAGNDMISWGWRIPFLTGGALTLLGLYLRTSLEESPKFVEAVASNSVERAPLQSVIRDHRRLLGRLLCVMGVNAAGYYLVLGYMATYLEFEKGFSPSRSRLIVTVALLVYVPLLYLFATLSDRIGRRRLLIACSMMFAGLSYPAFVALENGGFLTALVVQLLLVTILSLNDACFATYFIEAFPTSVRFSGFALPFNFGVAIFGGSMPLLAAWLIGVSGSKLVPAFLMTCVAIGSLPALLGSGPQANVMSGYRGSRA